MNSSHVEAATKVQKGQGMVTRHLPVFLKRPETLVGDSNVRRIQFNAFWCHCTMDEINFFVPPGGALIRKESVITGTRQRVKQQNKKKVYFWRNRRIGQMR